MTQNLIFLCGRSKAIALLDETLYAMINHRRVSGKHPEVRIQSDTNSKLINPRYQDLN